MSVPALRKDTILRIAPEVRFSFEDKHIVIRHNGNAFDLPLDVFCVLEAFKAPTAYADGVKRLERWAETPQEWMRLTGSVSELIRLGVLAAPEADVEKRTDVLQPGDASLHHLLLSDQARTEQYLAALRAVIRPTDIVLDIGTGTGVLAIGAAMAGANHVYAIEAGRIGAVAARTIEENGLSDRITLIRDWSRRVSLPEPADVLVSEIISNGVFGQNLLETTQDATRRLLKPGARLIPDRVRMMARLAQIPAEWLKKQRITDEEVALWAARYGINFSAMLDPSLHVSTVLSENVDEVLSWDWLSEPLLLADIDLAQIEALSLQTRVTAPISSAGSLNGVIIFFEADLAPGMVLSTEPSRAPQRPISWGNPVWLVTPLQVEVGDNVTLSMSHTQNRPNDYTLDLIKELPTRLT